MKAPEYLARAAEILTERGKRRDRHDGERSMARIVAAFHAITGVRLTVTQGWLFMACLKLVRMQTGPHDPDDALDLINYAALAGEEAAAPLHDDRGM